MSLEGYRLIISMRPIPIEETVGEDYFADMSVQMFSYNFLGFPEWWGS